MSKKLIAVASAAALALTALVGVAPVSATTTISGGSQDGLTAASAKLIPVPADNSVDSADQVVFTVSSAADRTVSATATGAVKLLTTSSPASGTHKANAGVTSLNISTGLATSVTFYAYTTSTAVGTVVVNDGVGNTQTFHIKGTSALPYNIAVTAPSSLSTGEANDMTIVVTDVFGNALETLGNYQLNFTPVAVAVKGADESDLENTNASTGTEDWDSVAKNFAFTLTDAIAGGAAVSVKLTSNGTLAPPAITGLAKPVATAFKSFSSADLSAQVASLTAQLAESRPKAKSVTKKRFNTLARKWNAAFPSQKVALKK
jgi:hypothetical protein